MRLSGALASNAASASSNSRFESGTPQERFIQHLTDLSNGNFLHTKHTLELIERGHLVLKSSGFKLLPVSLSEVFTLELNLRFHSSVTLFRKNAADILSVCLASSEPPTITEIFHSLTALSPDLTWQEFVTHFNQLSGFLVRRGDDTVMFHHPALRRFLLSLDEDSKYACNIRTGHLAVAMRMRTEVEEEQTAERTFQLANHVLKALREDEEPETLWLSCAGETSDPSAALATQQNVFCANVDVSRLLLVAGASPDHVCGFLRQAPLLALFAEQGHEEMVALLLEFGADVTKGNLDGVTPLMFAAMKGHLGE